MALNRWLILTFLLLSSCAGPASREEPERLSLAPVRFDDLIGWQTDHSSEALLAFLNSCRVLPSKNAKWQAICNDARARPPGDDQAARTFFEQWFLPFTASGAKGSEGLFTGYYEADLKGSLKRSDRYKIPLYARPDDLITVDLGAFKPDWKGKHLIGKVDQHAFVPYDERGDITKGSLDGRAKVLLWVDDPIDAFFLSVQGSGRIHLDDGSIVRVGFDSGNGHGYVAIGRTLADNGSIERPVTMAKIRTWLADNPAKAPEIMNVDASYEFFKFLTSDGPLGAEGVPLTDKRSLAVDPSYVSLGTPIWLDTTDDQGKTLKRLVISQDTGGAIKGPVRGDLYWGSGPEAALRAGGMQSAGYYYVLLPK